MKIKHLSGLMAFVIAASFTLTAFAISEEATPLSGAPYRLNSDTRLTGNYEGERTPIEIYGNATITLENANITVAGPDAYGIKINADANTTIVLLGENHISSAEAIGIISNSNIVFAGTGSLTISGLTQSVFVDARLTIGSGVSITSGNTGRALTISEATSSPWEEPVKPETQAEEPQITEEPAEPPEPETKPITDNMPGYPQVLPFEDMRDALATDTRVVVDDVEVPFECYNINGNNYFKLRDLAMALNGSVASFSVGWNEEANSISLVRGEAYEPSGTELTVKEIKNETAIRSSSQMLIDSEEVFILAYNIEGSNFYKLRDLGDELNFSVDWNEENRTIIVSTQVGE